MCLSTDSYRKLAKWTDEINEKTGNPKNFPTELAFAKAYIKNSFDFVVKNFTPDGNIQDYLSRVPWSLRHEKYLERTSLENLIQKKVGVCKQFSSVLCILTANDLSTLQKTTNFVSPGILACQVKLKNGKFDGHTINSFKIQGQMYFCDPTKQMGFKNRDFCLKSKQDMQKEYFAADESQICERTDNIEIKARDFKTVCDLVSGFQFITSTTTKDYKSTIHSFR